MKRKLCLNLIISRQNTQLLALCVTNFLTHSNTWHYCRTMHQQEMWLWEITIHYIIIIL